MQIELAASELGAIPASAGQKLKQRTKQLKVYIVQFEFYIVCPKTLILNV